MTKATDYEHAFKPYLYSLMPFIGGGLMTPPLRICMVCYLDVCIIELKL